MSNFSFEVFNDSKTMTRFNFTADLKTDLTNYFVVFTIKEKSSSTKEFDKTVASGSFNSCKLQQGLVGNFMAKMISDLLKEHSNFKFQCPQRKGYYYVINAPLSETSMLPNFLMGKPCDRQMSCKVTAKIPTFKAPVQVISLEILMTST